MIGSLLLIAFAAAPNAEAVKTGRDLAGAYEDLLGVREQIRKAAGKSTGAQISEAYGKLKVASDEGIKLLAPYKKKPEWKSVSVKTYQQGLVTLEALSGKFAALSQECAAQGKLALSMPDPVVKPSQLRTAPRREPKSIWKKGQAPSQTARSGGGGLQGAGYQAEADAEAGEAPSGSAQTNAAEPESAEEPAAAQPVKACKPDGAEAWNYEECCSRNSYDESIQDPVNGAWHNGRHLCGQRP